MNTKRGYLSKLLRTGNTVLSFKDILLRWGDIGASTARVRINYYVKHGELHPLRRGLYAKDKSYDIFELANKIYTPSYISFETVLAAEGIVFQKYDSVFVASYQTRDIECDGRKYSFKKIKDAVLTNQAGIENKGSYSIASKERAFLDTIYLNKNYHFDSLSPLDRDKVFRILPVYKNKRMERTVKQYFDSGERRK